MDPLTPGLRALRQARGWSQHALATRAGVRQDTVSGLETGSAAGVRRATLDRLAAALGVPRWRLFVPPGEAEAAP